MTTLHLGVIELPYADESYGTVGRRKPKHTTKSTTGDVADILEAHYHIMEIFFHLHEDEIIEAYIDSLMGATETAQMGGPMAQDPLAAASQKLERKFREWLTGGGMDGLSGTQYPVPTKAAQLGVSHRFKHPYAKRASRPSFIDTGLFEAAFRMWVEQ